MYEMSNHLGNVLVTISDRRKAVCNNEDSTLGYNAVVLTATDYYAFGSVMVGREYTSDTTNKYRYSFNGKETDSESDLQDYGMRIYSGDLGRFLSIDPLTMSYPWYTPFQFAGNTPIAAIDLDGLEEVLVNLYQKFGVFYLVTADYVEQKNRTDNRPHSYVEVTREDYSKEHRKEDGNKTKRNGNPIKTVDAKTPPNIGNKVNEFGFKGSGTFATWTVNKVDIYFETEVGSKSMKLSVQDETRLKQFAVILLVEDKYGLNINSFTDEEGDDKFNQGLSEERAKFAKDYIINYLTGNGVSKDKIKAISGRIYAKGNGEIKDGKGKNVENRKLLLNFVVQMVLQ